jgi:ParB family chromosome partitioning protein
MARPSGLGKGLGALIPTEVANDNTSALREVPIGAIKPNTYQPRSVFDEEAMSSLAASIKELGVLQPILVRPLEGQEHSFELIAGERRWRAARRAGLQTIPVLVRTEVNDLTSLEQALVENVQRSDLNVLEEAAAYQQLIDEFSLTHDQVSQRVGKSRVSVTNTLRLLQLPTSVQSLVADGALSAGHGRALLAVADRALQEALAARCVTEELSVRRLEAIVRGEEPDPAPEPEGGTGTTTTSNTLRRMPDPMVLELEELLSEHLSTRVKVDLNKTRGKLMVEFATLEDLERIYRAMLGSASTQG